MSEKISQIYKKLIVSCQALPDEPLHSSFIMGRMAKAAKEGGACGIRANSREDIEEIKRNVEFPIIGIVKKEYADSPVYITPTMREVDALVEAGADIIALDATGSRRPGGVLLDDFVEEIRNRYPGQPLMADCSTVEEVLHADRLGFDFLGTTLVGYTEQSAGKQIEENDFEIIRQILEKVNHPVIAEGNINTPQKARRVLEIGCYSVVVGSIITRPQVITRTFTEEIDKLAMAQE
ncbi:N-acetylmannosamine-6-phosphate 2-epimerase [Eisenbergiella tayi]|jgi:N-acylglucosamine-6-phosphate 2-epimerase|uniref:Putative N-acetylmannosamine-6-phosphate 2-epimerase n=1 Tax=Eisenbergiella tayi TaxID=1432052 RepID=A0A1E3ULU3_9FIRM|nr:N-acetylmannosamine-6-phosphate 2-epimerase [Eisenbergiella tayi]ODR53966.1 N-acetylmannosamine-6-phosphate 2-epimerase [Eisenbergiella tayi]